MDKTLIKRLEDFVKKSQGQLVYQSGYSPQVEKLIDELDHKERWMTKQEDLSTRFQAEGERIRMELRQLDAADARRTVLENYALLLVALNKIVEQSLASLRNESRWQNRSEVEECKAFIQQIDARVAELSKQPRLSVVEYHTRRKQLGKELEEQETERDQKTDVVAARIATYIVTNGTITEPEFQKFLHLTH